MTIGAAPARPVGEGHPQELIGRAEALTPLLRQNAAEAERLRRLPDESIRALEEAGLCRMAQPLDRGGHDTDAPTIAKVMASIANGCDATAWVLMIYNSVAQLAELLSDDALSEVYADQLQLHINNALNLGITRDELQEGPAQAGLYGGISGWSNASNVARDVLVKRELIDAEQR